MKKPRTSTVNALLNAAFVTSLVVLTFIVGVRSYQDGMNAGIDLGRSEGHSKAFTEGYAAALKHVEHAARWKTDVDEVLTGPSIPATEKETPKAEDPGWWGPVPEEYRKK